MQKTIVKGNPLNFNVGIQRWYIKELLKLVDKLTDSALKEISPLFREYKDQITFSQDASIQSQPSISSQARIRLNALRKEYEKKFNKQGATLAKKMLKKTNRYARTAFWSSIQTMVNKEVGQNTFTMSGSIISPEKEEAIKALLFDNVSYITSIQSEYFKQITGAVSRSIQAGLGITHIEKELMKYKGMTKRRARNIAEDQTRKAYNSINLRNMQETGVQEAEWLHSGGSQRPRDYHRTKWDGRSGLKDGRPNGLNGFIFRLDNPPVINLDTGRRGYPGDEPYCHCRMRPIIRFEV